MPQTGNGNDRVIIFDTTLRDGEQCPGATMTFEEKLQVAEMLDAIGVDVIEAGFPANGPDDFRAVEEIAKRTVHAVVCGLARALPADIDGVADAIRHARRGRIHTFIATSPMHMAEKLKKTPDQVLELIASSVSRARNRIDDVEWSAEDATQSEREFLARCVETAIKAGATTINIPDTCGFTEPEEYAMLITYLRETASGADVIRFSVHCHNDLGMAVTNSLYGIRAGARQVECTINGIGERAGNAALEEIVMAIKTREDRFPFHTGVVTTELTKASKLVSAVTSFPVQYNKAIVGRNAFAHESGIHQDGMLKNNRMYEIMRPETVGANPAHSLVMGKHSGSRAMKVTLQRLGYDVGDNQLADIMVRFKALAARKKEIYDEDIEALVNEEIAAAHDRVKLHSLSVTGGTNPPYPAAIALQIDGEVFHGDGISHNGSIDAIFDAIRRVIAHEAKLELYHVDSVGKDSESEAQAEVSVRLSIQGRSASAKFADPDTPTASAKAYIAALNKFVARGVVRLPTDADVSK